MSRDRAAVISAVLLVVASVLYLGLAAVLRGRQQHSYDGGRAPSAVQLTAGRTYELAVPGGRDALAARGVSADQPACTWSSGSTVDQPLTVTAVPADAHAVNQVATFVAPTGGRVEVQCSGWGQLFVDDSDDAAFDRSGLFLLLGLVAVVSAVGLGLGTLYRRSVTGVAR